MTPGKVSAFVNSRKPGYLSPSMIAQADVLRETGPGDRTLRGELTEAYRALLPRG